MLIQVIRVMVLVLALVIHAVVVVVRAVHTVQALKRQSTAVAPDGATVFNSTQPLAFGQRQVDVVPIDQGRHLRRVGQHNVESIVGACTVSGSIRIRIRIACSRKEYGMSYKY